MAMSEFEKAMLDETKAHNAKLQALAAEKATQPQAFVDASPNEQFQAMSDARRGRDNPPLTTTIVEGIVSATGGKFDVKIDHRNRVVDLLNYTWPEGHDKPVAAGGLVPDGYKIGETLHKHWMWTDFRQADINAFVGKPLPAHYRPAGTAKKVA